MKGHRIDQFAEVFDRCLGRGNYPQSLVGDLDDLLYTLEKSAKAVRSLSSFTGDKKEEISKQLYDLQMLLEDELAAVMKDVLPIIKDLRKGSIRGQKHR